MLNTSRSCGLQSSVIFHHKVLKRKQLLFLSFKLTWPQENLKKPRRILEEKVSLASTRKKLSFTEPKKSIKLNAKISKNFSYHSPGNRSRASSVLLQLLRGKKSCSQKAEHNKFLFLFSHLNIVSTLYRISPGADRFLPPPLFFRDCSSRSLSIIPRPEREAGYRRREKIDSR